MRADCARRIVLPLASCRSRAVHVDLVCDPSPSFRPNNPPSSDAFQPPRTCLDRSPAISASRCHPCDLLQLASVYALSTRHLLTVKLPSGSLAYAHVPHRPRLVLSAHLHGKSPCPLPLIPAAFPEAPHGPIPSDPCHLLKAPSWAMRNTRILSARLSSTLLSFLAAVAHSAYPFQTPQDRKWATSGRLPLQSLH